MTRGAWLWTWGLLLLGMVGNYWYTGWQHRKQEKPKPKPKKQKAKVLPFRRSA